MAPEISFYKNVKQTESKETVLLDIFLDAVKSGKWQDEVLKIRLIQDADQRRAAKTTMPNATISGVFDKRVDSGCKLHSGVIGMDLDGLGSDVEAVKALLSQDPYVRAAFVSIGGGGVCALFKIDPEKHREAFEGIADYLIKKYQLIVDPTGINPSRTRFVSYDPYLYQAENCLTFKKYLPKPKKRKITATIFVKTEFDEVVRQMVAANVSCVEDYRDWRDIAFGLADQFGEAGRGYFHQLSACSQKYESSMCDRQFTHALKRNGKVANKITIATIYYFAKQAGINIMSEKTKRIAAATSTMKKSGLNADTIAENLKKFEGVEGQDVKDIIQQAFAAGASFEAGESLVENVRMWLRHNYDLKRNEVTRKIENNGVILEEVDFNTMFLDCKIIFEKLDFKLFMQVILSHNTASFNPIKEVLESWEWDKEERLNYFGGCINSDTGTLNWRCSMVKKWIIGIIHSIYGSYSELNLILVGGKNTGKTEFFRKLLPPELKPYFAASQLNRGKDDEILMCEKLIILNDEYGGKNRMDEKNEKRLMGSDSFDLRKPYGKGNETILRIASLCGTSNPTNVLNDPTGNRRIIVIEAAGQFYFDLYNSVDKRQLFAEALQAWKSGERPTLTLKEIAILEDNTDEKFQKVSFEREMIQKYFLEPKYSSDYDFMTTTEIKNYLEGYTKEKLILNKLGEQLKKLGYENIKKRIYGYKIKKIDPLQSRVTESVTQDEQLPF